MIYRTIDCPHCGNPTTARSIDDAQKCRYCRRLFEVLVPRGQKGRKATWEAKAVDFPGKYEKVDRPRLQASHYAPPSNYDKSSEQN